MQFSKSKLLGVAEMPGKSIDVTCKSCDDVLELYKKIQAVSDMIKVKLYETDNIHVVVGWVPILPCKSKSQYLHFSSFEKLAKNCCCVSLLI